MNQNEDHCVPTWKEDLWSKNHQAHEMMRTKGKQKTGDYCTYCCHRRCNSRENELVYGNRSLKKSKIPIKGINKYVETSVLNPYFVNLRNGETTLEE